MPRTDIDSSNIKDKGIETVSLADGAVTNPKVGDNELQFGKMDGTAFTNAVTGGGTVDAIDTGLGSGPSNYNMIPRGNFNVWEDSAPSGGTIHVAAGSAGTIRVIAQV